MTSCYLMTYIQVEIAEWQVDGEVLQIVATINCPKERLAKYVIGGTGGKITRIAKAVNATMQNLLKQQLFVRLLVKANGKVIETIGSKIGHLASPAVPSSTDANVPSQM